MLASKFRLSGFLIPQVKKQGRLYRSPFFSLLVLKDKKQPVSKFGAIMSLKFDKKAVVRNQVKRKLLEATRLLIEETRPGFLVIFLPKRILQEKDQSTINQAVRKAFLQAGIL